jgi:molecular chaperone HtpG
MSQGILFQVETERILQILAKEIYDSPLALLRENVQNAYDAVRMFFAPSGELSEGGRIDINITGIEVSIEDNGIGMTEEVLRANFWKAGASGKNSDSARQAGVVGTFGIGAMANFGVSTRLVVETRAQGSSETFRSVAERQSLRIAEECITLERLGPVRPPGTKVTAIIDGRYPISVEQARQYLEPYVALLPVPVFLNGILISLSKFDARAPFSGRAFKSYGSRTLSDGVCGATFEIQIDANGQVLVKCGSVALAGQPAGGELALMQAGGQLMGLRSSFGLAPVPVGGAYQFGGIANLSFLQPTAGREALSRESIEQVSRIVALAERAASEVISETSEADKNNSFLQWVVSNSRYDLAARVSISILPDNGNAPLGDLGAAIASRTVHFYDGNDPHLIQTFTSEGSCLLVVARGNPRRQVQLHYLNTILKIPQIPDSVQVTRTYTGAEISAAEASLLLRVASILRDDYLIADVEATLADMSHGVTILPQISDGRLQVLVARRSPLLLPVLEFYDQAYDVFTQFMKDFVRVHVYPRIQQFVPSSTKDGVDALRKLLEKNRELYRYEESERGDLEGILGEFLSGAASFSDVLNTTRAARSRAQSQTVSAGQVGTIEAVVPDVVQSPVAEKVEVGSENNARPPIVRDAITSDMKILTTSERYAQLNSFSLFLGVSDRLMHVHSDFFRTPHTTRIIWGGHRVIYIFTEATWRLSLYYDIELREPIQRERAGGSMYPTTTIITKRRIFIPVPDQLVDEFRITRGSREFFVRFDLLSSDTMPAAKKV